MGENLSRDDELLDTVLGVAGDDEKMIRDGITKALRGVNDKARRTYLWGELARRATKRIRDARRKAVV